MERRKTTGEPSFRVEELKAWGFAARMLEEMLSKSGEGLGQMVDGMFETPRETFPRAMREIICRGDADEADRELLSALLAGVSIDGEYGTARRRIEPGDQGVIALAYCRFDRRMMTCAQAAEALGTSKAWIYQVMKKDPMSYAVIGGRRMIFARDVEKLAKAREGGGRPSGTSVETFYAVEGEMVDVDLS